MGRCQLRGEAKNDFNTRVCYNKNFIAMTNLIFSFHISGEDWQDVSFTEFTSCPSNMANNRQTRMLADLKLINCYDRWLNSSLNSSQIAAIEQVMLKSAIKNLQVSMT